MNEDIVFSTKEGTERLGMSRDPQHGATGWREIPNGRELVRWCAHFGNWLSKKQVEELRLVHSGTKPWDEEYEEMFRPKIYDSEHGGSLIPRSHYPAEWEIGWREKPDGTREMVRWNIEFRVWANKDCITRLHNDIGSITPAWEEIGGKKFRGERFGWLTDEEYIARLEQELEIKKG